MGGEGSNGFLFSLQSWLTYFILVNLWSVRYLWLYVISFKMWFSECIHFVCFQVLNFINWWHNLGFPNETCSQDDVLIESVCNIMCMRVYVILSVCIIFCYNVICVAEIMFVEVCVQYITFILMWLTKMGHGIYNFTTHTW